MPIWYQALAFMVWRCRCARVVPIERKPVPPPTAAELRKQDQNQQVIAIVFLLVVIMVVVGGVMAIFFPTHSDANVPSLNQSVTANAKWQCEQAWSLVAGSPQVYGVSHSDYVAQCVRDTP